MKIIVGSKNKTKVGAVEEIILDYAHLANAEVVGCEVDSEVGAQPMSLEEIIRGAQNRARNAFLVGKNCDYGIGLESGLMDVPYTKTGHMDVCACAIYDGREYHIGLSSAFECPKAVIDVMKEENIDLAAACLKLLFFGDSAAAHENGIISILTKGRLDRLGFTKQALRHALIHLEPKDP